MIISVTMVSGRAYTFDGVVSYEYDEPCIVVRDGQQETHLITANVECVEIREEESAQ